MAGFAELLSPEQPSHETVRLWLSGDEALQLGTDGGRLTLRNARGDTRTPTPPAAQGIEDDLLEKVESGGVIDASAYSELDVALRSSPAARV